MTESRTSSILGTATSGHNNNISRIPRVKMNLNMQKLNNMATTNEEQRTVASNADVFMANTSIHNSI